MSRGAKAHINLSALAHNFALLRKKVGARSIIAMVKSNAYGHGLVRIANQLKQADAFGVASLEEALILREANISQPIIVMSGFGDVHELEIFLRHSLTAVIHQPYQLKLLLKKPLDYALSVWLKIDTGMHRLGFLPAEQAQAYEQLKQCAWVRQPIGLMTHLADADNAIETLTRRQLQQFMALSANHRGFRSVANSAAIFAYPESWLDSVRPGIMLYGVSPFGVAPQASKLALQPVMTLKAKIIAIKALKRGDNIGYSARWQCPEDLSIAIVALGYGDGYPRHAKNGTPVLVNGKRCALVGVVSMDLLAIDLRPAPDAQVGDIVTLWGEGLAVEEIAAAANTIAYELLCNVSQRVEFVEH